VTLPRFFCPFIPFSDKERIADSKNYPRAERELFRKMYPRNFIFAYSKIKFHRKSIKKKTTIQVLYVFC